MVRDRARMALDVHSQELPPAFYQLTGTELLRIEKFHGCGGIQYIFLHECRNRETGAWLPECAWWGFRVGPRGQRKQEIWTRGPSSIQMSAGWCRVSSLPSSPAPLGGLLGDVVNLTVPLLTLPLRCKTRT